MKTFKDFQNTRQKKGKYYVYDNWVSIEFYENLFYVVIGNLEQPFHKLIKAELYLWNNFVKVEVNS